MNMITLEQINVANQADFVGLLAGTCEHSPL